MVVDNDQSSGSDRKNSIANSSFHVQSPRPDSPHAPISAQYQLASIATSSLSLDIAPPMPEIWGAIALIPLVATPTTVPSDVKFISPDSTLVAPAIRRTSRKCPHVIWTKSAGTKVAGVRITPCTLN
ncbi:hypothetical protein RUND412_002633 [Rhizina undulata]